MEVPLAWKCGFFTLNEKTAYSFFWDFVVVLSTADIVTEETDKFFHSQIAFVVFFVYYFSPLGTHLVQTWIITQKPLSNP